MPDIILRFVAGNDVESQAIIARSPLCMPDTPSHVECVTPEGLYAGERVSGPPGMAERKPGYDASYLAHEWFVHLPATDEQHAAFYAYMKNSIGEPYDWKAILDYALPVDFHDFNHAICSAKMVLGLRTKGCEWFPWPLSTPAHLIMPAMLHLMLSGIVKIDH